MNNGTQNLDNRESGQITIGACYGFGCSFFFSNTNFQNTNKIMIKANELRIGNAFEYRIQDDLDERKDWWEFSTIDSSDLALLESNFDYDYRPIKLTDKIILGIKGAFVAAKNKTKICITAPYGFEFHFDKYGEEYVLSVYCNTGCFVPQKCYQLHEFQNLYFSIVGEELVFSTEP